MNVDAAGVVHETGNALNKVASRANAPIFSYDDSYFDGAIVGGPMFSVLEGSRIAATVATRILDGEKAGDIKTPPIKYASPKFDWRQMQRWGISENNLPPGSSIHFRPRTAWETYRWQIVTVCAVAVLQGALIMLLLFERRRRHLAEMDSRQRGRTGPCQSLFDRGRIVRIDRPRNQSTAGRDFDQYRNCPANAPIAISRPWRNEEIITDIWRDNRRASEVVRRLRSFVSKAPFQRQDFDLNDVVVKSVKFLSAQARSREITMKSSRRGCRCASMAIRSSCNRSYPMVILNAMDAALDTLRVQRVVTVTTTQDRRFAEICVEDTGPGVPRKSATKIFEPFFSTQKPGWAWAFRSLARSSRRTTGR